MTTSATFDSQGLQVDPGNQAVIPLQIRNNGEIVEGYRIEVVGPPAAWTTVEPETVSVYPGTMTTATVAFHPPRSAAVAAGDQPFGVRVVPTEHPEDAVVPEGVVQVLPFLETTAEITPRTSRGTRGGRHQVAVDNRGNLRQTVVLSAADLSDQVRIQVRPEVLTVDPGHALFADVRLRPVKRIWRGAPVTHQFQVLVKPQDAPAVTLDASHLQQQTVPAWLPKALLALLALLVALAGLWFGLLRPTIRAAAEDAVEAETQKIQQQAGNAQAASQKAAADAAAAEKARTDAQVAEKATRDVADQVSASAPAPAFSARLGQPTDQGATETYLLDGADPEQVLAVTDIVLQNPQGDFGRATLRLGAKVLLSTGLENFRDNDYHYVSAIVGAEGDNLELEIQCTTPGVPPGQTPPPASCDVSAFVVGTRTVPTPTPAPSTAP